jgi:glycine/serine hydroxymethyltransferase
MQTVADLMDYALMNRTDESKLSEIKQQVKEFSLKFPVPGIE